jgi:hypothetical protein
MDRTLRLILTMLALVAGLGSAPAQARIATADAAEIERVESAGGVGLIAAAAAKVQGCAATERREACPPKPRPPVTTIVLFPAIQFGDRARE